MSVEGVPSFLAERDVTVVRRFRIIRNPDTVWHTCVVWSQGLLVAQATGICPILLNPASALPCLPLLPCCHTAWFGCRCADLSSLVLLSSNLLFLITCGPGQKVRERFRMLPKIRENGHRRRCRGPPTRGVLECPCAEFVMHLSVARLDLPFLSAFPVPGCVLNTR